MVRFSNSCLGRRGIFERKVEVQGRCGLKSIFDVYLGSDVSERLK